MRDLENQVEFEHAQARRSLKHRYAELEGEVSSVASAASHNELVTRERVKALEAWVGMFSGRDFRGRLRWLVLGR